MAKARPSRTKTIPEPADVRVKVDGKLKQLWDEQHKVLEQAKGRGAKAFDVLWEAVDAIVNHDPPLYVVGEYGSAREFFAKELHETERTALRNIRVARYATAAQEERLGVSTLDAAIAFLEAKNGGPLGKAPIDFDRLKVPVRIDGAMHFRALEHVTVKDIQAATSAMNGAARRKPKTETMRGLEAELAAQRPLADVAVTEHKGVFSFRNVPAGALQHFGHAVARGAGRAGTQKVAASKSKSRR